jgi:hypothetical protein
VKAKGELLMTTGHVAQVRRKRGALYVVSLLCVAISQLIIAGSASAAGELHAFDPFLSLTGGTGVSKVDPVPDPAPHPPEPFYIPCGVAVDVEGNVYVSSLGKEEDGRIDIFDPEGHFLTEIPNPYSPCNLAVDAEGNLYVGQVAPGHRAVLRYTPEEFPLEPGTTYEDPVVIDSTVGSTGIAVDPSTGHLFIVHFDYVLEFSSAATGNSLIRSDIGEGVLNFAEGIAVDGATGRIFVASVCTGCYPIPEDDQHVSLVYVFDTSGTLIGEIDGSDIPGVGGFNSAFGQLSVAIDETTREVFVSDVNSPPDQRVYRFVETPEGSYEYVADPELEDQPYVPPGGVAVANGAGSPNRGNVYVTLGSHHLFAFTPEAEVTAPVVEGTEISGISETEAVVEATVNPGGAATDVDVEYIPDATYQANIELLGSGHGFDGASRADGGALAASNQPSAVSMPVFELSADTAYRVRIVATNACNPDPEAVCMTYGEVVRFSTYPIPPQSGSCPNSAFRVGLSAALPDCRAYELVTPSDTNGREPTGAFVGYASGAFETQLAGPEGNSLLFMTIGGSLPGLTGNGFADGYLATRTDGGWVTGSTAPSGAQSQAPSSGSASADHRYWLWDTGGESDSGSLAIGDSPTHYVRNPDGSFALVGRGPLGTDPSAVGEWVSVDGAHLILTSSQALAEGAPPSGNAGIYDITADGVTHAVSLAPSGDGFGVGAAIAYQGASANGEVVAFTAIEGGGPRLYERRSNTTTIEVDSGVTTFAGLSQDGRRLTYVKGGNIYSFDAESNDGVPVSSGGESIPVNVSADGSHVYFVSPKVLAPGGAIAGKENLYVWSANTSTVTFVARLLPIDVVGEKQTQLTTYGLGQWTEAIGPKQGGLTGPANDPSRTTPDGRAIVFESRANLTGYDTEGFAQIYRYEIGAAPALTCLSCPPTQAAPSANARLQAVWAADDHSPVGALAPIHNIAIDGRRVFFQSPDPLVAQDVDDVQDVYEWMTAGINGCTRARGCLKLISSGRSANGNYLYAVDADGSDVFFATSDILLPADRDITRSIYDARIDGGFSEGLPLGCEGEACKAPPSGVSDPPRTGTVLNVRKPRKSCHKNQRKVRRHGKVRCVRKHHRSKRSTSTGGAR